MNAFQTCKDSKDIVPLYLPQQLYLKPVAKLSISLQLPNVVKVGKSISHWEIMEKIRELIKPEEFNFLKVSKTTLEFVRFEAEVDSRKKLEPIVNKLDNKTIKLKNFSELMRLRSAVVKSDFPTRQMWDGFFQEARDMNEMKPGERPDTIHLSNLPTKWFVPYHLSDEDDLLPSEKVFYKIFEKFGPIRYVDIPICDPYRDKMKDHISGIKNCSWEKKEFFEGYVQFRNYMGFTKCMDFFRDMKLVHKDENEILSLEIKVNFDRFKHLTDASIRRREIVRDRLVKKQREKEEKERNELEEKKKKEEAEKQKELDLKLQKEQRRKLREEKRKAVMLQKLKIKGSDEINAKIAKEEKKLIKVQRKLESIRLVEELFKRIKDKKDTDDTNAGTSTSKETDNELRKYKNTSELEVLNQKQTLQNATQGRVMLKTVLQGEQLHEFSSSSSDEDLSPASRRQPVRADVPFPNRMGPGNMYEQHSMWYGYPYHMPPAHAVYPPPIRGHPAYNMFPMRRRGGYHKGPQYPGPSRGSYFPRRPRGFRSQHRGGHQAVRHYPVEMEEEYIKYFSKFLRNEYNDCGDRSRSRSGRSRSRSYSRNPSSTRDRSYSRSVSRNRRSRSNSRSRRSTSRPRSSTSRGRTYSRSRRSRTRSVSRSRRSISRSRKSGSRSRRSRTSKRTSSKDKSEVGNKSSSRRSQKSRRTCTPEADLSKEKVTSPKKHRSRSQSNSIKSIDSSKFISPSKMRRDRSKSWSLPKYGHKGRRDSWSRSPEQK